MMIPRRRRPNFNTPFHWYLAMACDIVQREAFYLSFLHDTSISKRPTPQQCRVRNIWPCPRLISESKPKCAIAASSFGGASRVHLVTALKQGELARKKIKMRNAKVPGPLTTPFVANNIAGLIPLPRYKIWRFHPITKPSWAPVKCHGNIEGFWIDHLGFYFHIISFMITTTVISAKPKGTCNFSCNIKACSYTRTTHGDN